MRILYIYIFF